MPGDKLRLFVARLQHSTVLLDFDALRVHFQAIGICERWIVVAPSS
jgi:hypothetical protein